MQAIRHGTMLPSRPRNEIGTSELDKQLEGYDARRNCRRGLSFLTRQRYRRVSERRLQA
jgi:hypothetical protein